MIYLALYPPLDPSEQSAEVSKDNGVPEFPNELGALGDKQVLIPTLSTSIAAQDLLIDFASTNSPEAMFRGLPTYPVPGSDPAPNDIEEEQDSFIARHSKCIKAARNCWEILREGFIQRQVEDFVVPRKGRRRRKRLNDDGNGLDMSRLSFDSSNPVVVGKHSWPVLQWFLAIFEREETLAKERDQRRFSSLW